MTRYKQADSGIFFVDTDEYVWLLALSFPIWSRLSINARKYGEIVDVETPSPA